MARPRQPAAHTLEQRLAADLAMSDGRMPIGVIVADEAERAAAQRFLAGKRGAKLLAIVTAAESAARRHAWLRRAGVPQ